MTIAGMMSPVLLLILTFGLSAGDAFETPTWRAVLPELVQKDDLPAASALNGIEFNFARAVGPALAGFVIAFAGIGTAFVLNTVSFFGVILVVARWKRPYVKRTNSARPLLPWDSRSYDSGWSRHVLRERPSGLAAFCR
jgi:MFS family permease